MSGLAIELENVTKAFGARRAVDGLDLRVPQGALYGFVGPNGSGKTTTLRMILRILLPTTGSVRVLGADVSSAADDRTGYLPEERGLYRRLKVREVLLFFARLKGVANPGVAVDRWLDRLGLWDRSHEKVETLSKGLAQKLQFAAAVVHDPRLLILDEPFSGLDPVNVEAMRDVVLELRRKGTTIVLSTHDMSVAERMCDGVMMLHQGVKVLDGSVEEIKTQRGTETIRIRFAGDTPPLGELPGVEEIRDYGREQTLHLGPGQDTQALLRDLMARGNLNKFEVGRPSLHEIFISIAGKDAVNV